MPKARFADRGPKKKSIKARAVLSSKRKLSRFGKKGKKGLRGGAALYVSRSRAITRLQISLKDFRRLCILKGIYPREPSNRKSGDTQVRRRRRRAHGGFGGGGGRIATRRRPHTFRAPFPADVLSHQRCHVLAARASAGQVPRVQGTCSRVAAPRGSRFARVI